MISRRQALTAAAALPLLAQGGKVIAQETAPSPPAPAASSASKGVTLGGFAVTTLLAGSRVMENPHETFGTNASAEDFAALAKQNFLPSDKSRNFFTPVLVQTAEDLVLFDTGLDAEGITQALNSAGVGPDQITAVVLTHMHGDHIGGITKADGSLTFAKARYLTGRVEYDHWAKAGNEGFDTKIKPLADRFTFLEDGGAALGGITALLAPGHTPGHMVYHLESNGARMMLTADTANHYVFSLQRPDWEVRFDADKAVAAASRHKIFDMIATDRIAFSGYHMPAPGLGYIEKQGEGFHFIPHSYQLSL